MPSHRSEASVPLARPVLEPLTGLRFVAAIAVVLYHLPMKPFPWEAATRLVAYGYLGVSFFFVLSGFILTYTYIDPETGALRGSIRDFWWGRIARIYPVYLLALLVSLPIFAIFRVLMVEPAARPTALLSALLTPFLMQAWWPNAASQWNTPGWSLSVELFFYALFPFAAVWLARRRHSGIIGVLAWLVCLAIPLTYLALASPAAGRTLELDRYFWLQAIKFNPIAHLGEFTVGVAAGLAFMRRSTSPLLASPLLERVGLAGVVLVAAVAATTDWLPYALCHNGLFAPLWASLVLGLARSHGRVARLLGSRPIARLGEASFALYLLHSPLIGYHELVRGLLRIRQPGLSAPAWLQAAVFLVVAIWASLLVFRRVEQPARRLVRDWALVRRPRPGSVVRVGGSPARDWRRRVDE
jgi:peptidoglycan/LPS O-acetylase OafA/YrhL